jgi:hypothetical protein
MSLEAELRSRVQSITDKKSEVHRLDLALATVTTTLQNVSFVILSVFVVELNISVNQ